MLRREYLSRAAVGTALLFGGIGTAIAATDDEVVQADLVVVNRDASASSEANVECAGTEVIIDGVIRVSDSCQTAALGDVRFDDGTLTVVVEETRREDAGDLCLQVVTGVDYVANVTLSVEPEAVEVVHRGVEETTFTHECEDVVA